MRANVRVRLLAAAALLLFSIRPGESKDRKKGVRARFSNFRSLHCLSQRVKHVFRAGRIDWVRLARQHHGKFVARSVLASERAARIDRSS